ncbi:S-layer homology domain-containing protein [Aneurinibacillus sp. Ricciae_BoGa-3]|uniref:S-layer homology domain-containing protein n=1 Tax=Aneurinibacillus sp. Ricciae_BoGa-3 TaxID=3022697 RepID=UPI002342643C|nr:S-layer homology domain-containing protein [Aneurinibacillus sp. Ricciae_BoGa-3]WCK54224.1 S-layer homology domain-containing protein [Aneurinibacillus sp. Ricciae_BoGa-3]
MKKLATAISVISSLSLTAVPVFAQGNIHVKTNGYAHHVNQKNINVKANKIAHQSIKVNNSVHTTNNYIFNDIKGNWAEQDILDLVQKGILTGMGNNKFEPNGQVTREQFATMVSKFFSLKNTSSTKDFNDVSSDRWSYTSIEAAKNYIDAYEHSPT